MKTGFDRVLAVSNDRPDLGETESPIKPERDHRAIARLEREQGAADANQLEG